MKTLMLLLLLSTISFARVLPDSVLGLTVLVEFPDRPATIDREIIDSAMNGSNFTEYGNYGSVYQYYRDASLGKLQYKNLVTDYIMMDNSFSSYNKYADAGSTYDTVLVRDALEKLNELEIDFTKLTTGNDTAVAVNVLYPSKISVYSSNYSLLPTLWPHTGTFQGNAVYQGVQFKRFQISNTGDELSVGTMIHENGHMLFGWEDLYSQEDMEHSYGIGNSGVMCDFDSFHPIFPNPYYRFLAGWIDTVDITGVPYGSEYTLYPNDSIAYVYRKSYHYPGDETGFFFLEYRTQDGWNELLPDEGLAVWRINTEGDNRSSGGAQYIELVQADGFDDLGNVVNKGDDGDFFKTGDVLSDSTVPDALWSYGHVSLLNLFDIEIFSDSITYKTGQLLNVPIVEDIVLLDSDFKYSPVLSTAEIVGDSSGVVSLNPTGVWGGQLRFDIDTVGNGVNVKELSYVTFYKEGGGAVSLLITTLNSYTIIVVDQGDGVVTVNLSRMEKIYREFFSNITIAFDDSIKLRDFAIRKDSTEASVGYVWTGLSSSSETLSSSAEIIWRNANFNGLYQQVSSSSVNGESSTAPEESSSSQNPSPIFSQELTFGKDIQLITPNEVFTPQVNRVYDIYTVTGALVEKLPQVRNVVYVVRYR